MATTTTKAPERLFGQPGDEWLDGDIHTAAERVLDAYYPDRPDKVVIEEWSVLNGLSLVPPAHSVVERLLDDILDDYPHEGIEDALPAADDPALLAAVEPLRKALAERIRFSIADKRVASHEFVRLPDADGREAWRCDDLDVTISFPLPASATGETL